MRAGDCVADRGPERLLKTATAAARLDVSPATLIRWEQRGLISAVPGLPQRRYRESDISRLAVEGAAPAGDAA